MDRYKDTTIWVWRCEYLFKWFFWCFFWGWLVRYSLISDVFSRKFSVLTTSLGSKRFEHLMSQHDYITSLVPQEGNVDFSLDYLIHHDQTDIHHHLIGRTSFSKVSTQPCRYFHAMEVTPFASPWTVNNHQPNSRSYHILMATGHLSTKKDMAIPYKIRLLAMKNKPNKIGEPNTKKKWSQTVRFEMCVSSPLSSTLEIGLQSAIPALAVASFFRNGLDVRYDFSNRQAMECGGWCMVCLLFC